LKKIFTFFAFIICCALSALASTNLVDLGTGDELAFETSSNLVILSKPASPAQAAMVRIFDTNKICEMRMRITIQTPVPTWQAIKADMISLSQRMLVNAEEKEIVVKEIHNPGLTLFYYELTDNRPNTGDGKYMLQGVGTDEIKYLIQFMMLTNQKSPPEKAQIIQMLSTMRIHKKI
jgi:hypothetical protein